MRVLWETFDFPLFNIQQSTNVASVEGWSNFLCCGAVEGLFAAQLIIPAKNFMSFTTFKTKSLSSVPSPSQVKRCNNG